MKITSVYSLGNLWFAVAYFINILCIAHYNCTYKTKAHNTHCIQQYNQFLLNERAIFQFSKSWIW